MLTETLKTGRGQVEAKHGKDSEPRILTVRQTSPNPAAPRRRRLTFSWRFSQAQAAPYKQNQYHPIAMGGKGSRGDAEARRVGRGSGRFLSWARPCRNDAVRLKARVAKGRPVVAVVAMIVYHAF